MPGAVSPQLDFTLLNGVLFVSLIVLIIYGILLLFIQSYVSGPGPEDCLGSGVKGWWCQDGASERQSRDGSGGTFLGKCLGERKGGGTTKAGRVVQPRGPMRPQVRDRKGVRGSILDHGRLSEATRKSWREHPPSQHSGPVSPTNRGVECGPGASDSGPGVVGL